MKRKILFLVFVFIISFSGNAQSRITDYFFSDMKSSFPNNMSNSVKWIDSTFSKLFVSNFQFSESYNHDSSFYSFNLASRVVKKIPFYKLNGVVFCPDFTNKGGRFLSTKRISAEYSEEIKAYFKEFDYNSLNYSDKDYFNLAVEILRIDDGQLIANTLNRSIELDYEKENRFKDFINKVNKRNKLKLKFVSEEEPIQGLIDEIKKKSKLSVKDVIYNSFIFDKDKKIESLNLSNFFGGTTFGFSVTDNIDKILTPSLKIKFENTEKLVFSSSVLKALNQDECSFSIENIEAKFDFKNKETEIVMFGNSGSSCNLIKAKKIYYEYGERKTVEVKDVDIAPFDRIKIVINEEKIYLQVFYSTSNEEYVIVESVF